MWFVCMSWIVLSFVLSCMVFEINCILFSCGLFVWFVLLLFWLFCNVFYRLYLVFMWFVCMACIALLCLCVLFFERIVYCFLILFGHDSEVYVMPDDKDHIHSMVVQDLISGSMLTCQCFTWLGSMGNVLVWTHTCTQYS